jgi:S-adenosylmethionine decarboxylase
MTQHWGYHLMLDCGNLECDIELLNDKDYLIKFVEAILETTQMKAWGEPVIERLGDDCIPELSGYTVVQLLHTSNMCLHVCDKIKTLYFDLFSCKKFDCDKAQKVVEDFFKPQSVRTSFLTRQA